MIRILNSSLKSLPRAVLKPHTSAAIGAHHSLILSPDATGTQVLYAIGSNDFGQCGFSQYAGNGIFDEEEEEMLVEWTEMMNGLQDDQISCIKCGDFHSVALTVDGTVKTWGSGILGHGNEWYDSKPHAIKFFETIGRRVTFISAKSAITGCLANSKNELTEAYIWGYSRDKNKNFCKALSPVLVKAALQLTDISSITCGFNGSFAIFGKKYGLSTLQIYNALPERSSAVPYAPFCEDVQVINQVYDDKPTIELSVDDSTHSISLGSDAAFFVENNVAKLLDYESMQIHNLNQGIETGTLASNSILLASSNSIYSYGFENSEKTPPKEVPFYEFLLESLKRSSKEKPLERSKSTLELLKEVPRQFKITKPPISLVASYKDFFILNKD